MGRKSLADKRKPEILDHFYQVLIKEGLQGASIAKIATHMGVNSSLLTHYFHSKEEMVHELLEDIFKKYAETFMVKIKKIRDPEKRFDALLDTFFGVEWDHLIDGSVFYACFYKSFRSQQAKRLLNQRFYELREFVRQEIELGMKAGILKETDTGMAADLIIAIQEGVSFYESALGEHDRTEAMYQYLREGAKKLLKK